MSIEIKNKILESIKIIVVLCLFIEPIFRGIFYCKSNENLFPSSVKYCWTHANLKFSVQV